MLALVLAVNVLRLMEELRIQQSTYGYDFADFDEGFRQGDYPEILRMNARNEGHDIETTYDVSEYVAMAEYYMNASYYKMYRDAGEDEKAAEYMEKLEGSRELIRNEKRFGRELERIQEQFLK